MRGPCDFTALREVANRVAARNRRPPRVHQDKEFKPLCQPPRMFDRAIPQAPTEGPSDPSAVMKAESPGQSL
jgi:hypothetical protein